LVEVGGRLAILFAQAGAFERGEPLLERRLHLGVGRHERAGKRFGLVAAMFLVGRGRGSAGRGLVGVRGELGLLRVAGALLAGRVDGLAIGEVLGAARRGGQHGDRQQSKDEMCESSQHGSIAKRVAAGGGAG
jgi:hypothetical protein